MNLSYWEIKSWLTNVDYTIIGSGIVGLTCALNLKKRFPKANILLLEKGVLPQGASTKNAGFACFGSLSEIIEDLKTHSEQEVINLIKNRIDGLQLLRGLLGDKTINYKQLGGYELFDKSNTALFDFCFSKKEDINTLLKPFFKLPVFSFKTLPFNFKNIKKRCSYNPYEGQIDTGEMMLSLKDLVLKNGIKILNGVTVKEYIENTSSVKVKTNLFEFSTSKLFIATNGFSSQLLQENVMPARAQVLITKPIQNLQIKGTFHLDMGYYFFRNINNRILLGGGRHLDFKTEETVELNQTKTIQNALENLLKTIILPETPFEIEQRWSGIMGVGNQKKAIIKRLSQNVFCGIRLGGMGVAIGSYVGKKLAALVD